jgi:signal transduction histidine kinase
LFGLEMTMEKDLALAGLMHDLNNVLQTLGQAADLLSTDPEWGSLAETMIASVERGKRIVESAVEQPSRVDLAEVAANACRLSRIAVSLDIPPDLSFVGKPLAIERVLANLLVNSASAGAGNVSIVAKDAKDAKEEKKAGGEEEVRIEFADDGPGISEEVLREIFQPGYSTSDSTGLGLHIVESIVRDHGGSVEAFPGKGARFVIRIPKTAAAE